MMPTRQEKAVLDIIDKSLRNYASHIEVPTLMAPSALQNLVTRGINENPEWFYVKGFKTLYSPVAGVLYPDYVYSRKQAQELFSRCESTAIRLVQRITERDAYSQALRAHDFLARNVVYEDTGEREDHTIIGPFVHKKCVCEGYAKAFKYMLDKLHIPCLVVIGTGYDQSLGTEGAHAWNLAQINGQWTHIDVTFDTTIRGDAALRYDYFGLSTEEILRDHSYSTENYPTADGKEYGYYRRNNLVMYKREQLKDLIVSGLRHGQIDFAFQLPATIKEEGLKEEVFSEIESILIDRCVYRGFSGRFNLRQRVFQIHLN